MGRSTFLGGVPKIFGGKWGGGMGLQKMGRVEVAKKNFFGGGAKFPSM